MMNTFFNQKYVAYGLVKHVFKKKKGEKRVKKKKRKKKKKKKDAV